MPRHRPARRPRIPLRAGVKANRWLAPAAALASTILAAAGAGAYPPAARAARAARAAAGPSCVPSRLNASEALAGERVTVSPGPETRDASASTQISMLGVPADEIEDVSVTGSRSGVHPGRLLAYSQGDGASFVPQAPFLEGEHVAVRAELLQAGQAPVSFSWGFTVAVRDQPGSSSAAVVGVSRNPNASGATPVDYRSFHSRPELRPPDVTVSGADRTATGDLFVAPYAGVGQYGPMVLDPQGELVWFKALGPVGTRAGDLRVQQYEGQRVLTWWQDPLTAGGSSAAGDVIANSAYQTVGVVRAGNGYQPDLHEFQITPQNTALITVYDAIDCDLAAVGGPSEGAVADTLFQEIDLRTGLVMYEWHSLDHVALTNSYYSAATTSSAAPFDDFHINSVAVEQNGDFLVDARNTWAAYDVDAKTGAVQWELGGKHSSFKMGPGTTTAWQHDAVQLPEGPITFFDNGASPQVQPQSRAIEVALDMQDMTATLVRSYEHKNPLVADSQGNVQVTPEGDWMVGWGQAGYFSELSPSGQVLFNAHLPPQWESYRAFVSVWSGRPTQPPAIAAVAASSGHSGGTVYASWNGATEVVSWRVLQGAAPGALNAVATTPKTGFETAVAVPGMRAGGYVAAQALDAEGAVMGTSRTLRVSAAP